MQFRLGIDRMHLGHYERLEQKDLALVLAPETRSRLRELRHKLEDRIAKGETIYGINTGFGRLKDFRVPDRAIPQLQINLIRSHAGGIGNPLVPEIVRGVMGLRAHTLARGHSGVRPELIQRLCDLIENDVIPWIPEQGSVGASGDLAPLAHMALVVMGEGQCWEDGRPVPAPNVFAQRGLPTTFELQAREGLALINGTQVSTAVLAHALLQAYRTLAWANAALAMTLDAVQGSIHAADPEVFQLRPYAGMQRVAEHLRRWLEGSQILEAHKGCGKIQDPYSLRCAPQVHGSVLESLHFIQRLVETEMNSVTDNPLLFPDGHLVYNGNFHGAPMALAADLLAISMATLGAISERRLFLINAPDLSNLPPFLAREPGLNSGMMMIQILAASLANENKTLAHPSSVDTVPTSDNQEDHVSMSMWAARKALQVTQNTYHIVIAELMAAAQGLEFRRPLKSGTRLEALHAALRHVVPFREQDAWLSDDLNRLLDWCARSESCSLLEQQGLGPRQLWRSRTSDPADIDR